MVPAEMVLIYVCTAHWLTCLNFSSVRDSSMIGLTEDEKKFGGWQICSPELARAIAEFKSTTVLNGKKHSEFYHHEDSLVFKGGFQSTWMLLQKNSSNSVIPV